MTVEQLAEALPRHRTCKEDVLGHDRCLWEARRILANLERLRRETR